MSIKSFKDNLAKDLFGSTLSEAHETGLCISCKKPALPKCYSKAGKKEYYISGLCEICFDRIVSEDM